MASSGPTGRAAASTGPGRADVKVLVTGAAGHLGDALLRLLRAEGREAAGADIEAGPGVDHVGDIADAAFVGRAMRGVGAVLHAATLHKPHVATHARQAFVDVNITGTLNLLEAARAAGVSAFVFTSTTSVFGDAMAPPPGAPAVWIDENVLSLPKNIYGVTKLAAEDLCRLFHRKFAMPVVILRTSRFFPEEDDSAAVRGAYAADNAKLNEMLHRRVDIEDAAAAHLSALQRAEAIGFGRYVVSATTPFGREDAAALRADAPGVLARVVPDYPAAYARLGWTMFPSLDRVYDNAAARRDLGWAPRHDFRAALARAASGGPVLSDLAAAVGAKGYHRVEFEDGPYPVD